MLNFDFAVYGATPAGIMAAVSAARLGMRTVIIEPTDHIGGLMTSGLNATDTVDPDVIKGLSREFFRRVSHYYGTEYLSVRVESKVAKRLFMQMLAEEDITLLLRNEISSLLCVAGAVSSAVLSDESVVTARWWVDATYEGDLLPKAEVSFSIGRESRSTYDEEWAGIQKVKPFLPWGVPKKIAPREGKDYIPYVTPYNFAPLGSADSKVQSYCIRVTLTCNKPNTIPIVAPEDFDFSKFDMFRQLGSMMSRAAVRATWHQHLGITLKSGYFNLAEIPNGKFDMNSGPMIPTNNPVLTSGWIEAPPSKRQEMTEEFRRYTMAVLHFMQNDPSVPFAVQSFISNFGLPADEYTESENFPPQVYVREGRRLVGDRVFTQNDVLSGGVDASETVSQTRYHLDCKPVSWSANRDGTNIVREGMFFSQAAYKYNLPAWVILPKRGEARNLFSVCGVSASHVAFGSIRMEPTWMELGSIAAIIAHIADESACHPHDVAPAQIRRFRDTKLEPVEPGW